MKHLVLLLLGLRLGYEVNRFALHKFHELLIKLLGANYISRGGLLLLNIEVIINLIVHRCIYLHYILFIVLLVEFLQGNSRNSRIWVVPLKSRIGDKWTDILLQLSQVVDYVWLIESEPLLVAHLLGHRQEELALLKGINHGAHVLLDLPKLPLGWLCLVLVPLNFTLEVLHFLLHVLFELLLFLFAHFTPLHYFSNLLSNLLVALL